MTTTHDTNGQIAKEDSQGGIHAEYTERISDRILVTLFFGMLGIALIAQSLVILLQGW